jgi:Rrf2 family protein
VLLSKSCEYAIRTALYVATRSPGGYTAVREVSERLGMPYPFLAKIVQALTQAAVLRTLRGPNGGIALARTPEEITLKEIVVAIDGPALFRECVLGLPGCGDRAPCPLHAEWAPTRARVERMFGEMTLAVAADDIRSNDRRLSSLIGGG